LFETIIDDGVNDLPEEEKVLFQHDNAVRTVFLGLPTKNEKNEYAT